MLGVSSSARWPSVCLLWRNVSLEMQFLDWVVWYCLGCVFDIELHKLLYVLKVNPRLVTSFANIFSHSMCCLFILFTVSFAVQNLFSLISSHLLIFVIFNTLGVGQKRSCCDLCQTVFCLCFPLRVSECLVLHLDLSSILSLFLCMMLENVLLWFFCV